MLGYQEIKHGRTKYRENELWSLLLEGRVKVAAAREDGGKSSRELRDFP